MCARLAIVGALLAALLLSACGDDPPKPTSAAPPAWKTTARARAAALFAGERFPEARDALKPLLEKGTPDAEDLVRAGIVANWIGDPGARERALAHFGAALKAAPNDPAVHYNLASIHKRGHVAKALVHALRAHVLAPHDYPTALLVGELYALLDQLEAAAAIYQQLKDEVGVEGAGSWHLITLYRLAQLRLEQGRRDEALALLDERRRLVAKGITVPSADEIKRGRFGSVAMPPPKGSDIPPPVVPPVKKHEGPRAMGSVQNLRAWTLVDDWRHEGEGCIVNPPDIVGWGMQGLMAARTDDGVAYTVQQIHAKPISLLAALDMDNDGTLGFVLVSRDKVVALIGRDGAWTPAAFGLPAIPNPPKDMEPVDFDHDGDVDLLLVGAFGARLWRNDGIGVDGGKFTDATKDAGLPVSTPFTWCLIEDFDTDQDVDLLMGGAPSHAVPAAADQVRTYLADNQRGGRFVADSKLWEVFKSSGEEPLVADLTGDGRPDLVPASAGESFFRRRLRGRFEKAPLTAPGETLLGSGSFVHIDVDLDGVGDLFRPWASWRTHVVLAPGHFASRVGLWGIEPPQPRSIVSGAAWGDFDGDRQPDRVFSTRDGLLFLRSQPPRNRGFTLALRGIKSNRRGVGAVVEVRAGPIYRRIFWRGEPERIGIGTQPKADVIRVTWPNGVVQHDMDTPAGCARLIEQAEGLVGSCPFLYTWNGETYSYISDVLGITPMGLPMAPGMLVPPDHDEYVRVRGEQMKPRTLPDGSSVYEMQFTEELREVTYLDRARLFVVDHPADTEMFPTERFSFPPFPKHHINVVKPFAPVRATGSDGKTWTKEIAAIDGEYAAHFERYRGQFQGLAHPHWLELEFDKAAVAGATKLRLLFTGWLFWTNASVNMAAARTPGIAFVPPILQVPVPGNGGGWEDCGPPVGFPAGKTKTMVLDVSKILNREDPRLRVFSTLRLYWDSIRLAVGDDGPSSVQTVEPTSGHLWERGFSKPLKDARGLEWFSWDETEAPRWNQHPGMYTKHGEVLPLLTAIDDRFVILGAGDALRLRFDASGVAPLRAGWRRDYLVFLDGWAKDRDPNTHEALFVEPLPFHGMSGYPYRADERYPDDEAHQRYRDMWNTRPERTWIPSLVPAR